MSKRPGRATWFQWQLAWRDSLLSLTKEQLADVLTLAMEYFSENTQKTVEEMDIKDPVTRFAFLQVKQGIDAAFIAYRQSVDYGTAGAEKRKQNEGKGG